MPAVTDEEIVYVTDPQSGIKIPEKLAAMSAPVESFQANPWNPNKMDAFMREKLISSIQRDGFFQPLLVRPLVVDHIPVPGKWEIIDGEHRWKVGKDDLGMGALPYINLGQIGDAAAKAITIRANMLRGEFDAVALAEVVGQITADLGRDEALASLSLTTERFDSMLDLDAATRQLGESMLDSALAGATGTVGGGASAGDRGTGDFRSFDPDSAKLQHTCPKCNYQFNDK